MSNAIGNDKANSLSPEPCALIPAVVTHSSMPQVARATAPADALPPLAGAGMDGGVQR